ncbi:UNVERIFIED_ORG: putative transcriptional regulator [Methylobacterium sp. SuP10 SLI 274]|uniref:ribbon-helix-helix domain-containing protein n=1 Tax=Methylorubrum extorquens TaxID=408 RepID=UPI0020A17A5A|nr:CopG family transcriptional regulator [Methylorubrum extorquens]MDF9866430.1 putative transcriptional regulator [Methylorubrum pseudosasae]MDH6639939.1 putative transcriptional regulator [Methylobacterium sp. SuP10 SLI 274]MDH6669307.1 putative transcriptional regulator [Methylorubrum zatmanii]MCP1561928.1 putative transcriptional regulator [Methylorubrum extorquens]MDF9794727.1 putative transcriptional regulator [Methylorubrum extorquens]
MAGSEKKSVRTSVILPEEAHARVQALADANDVSAAWVIRAAILRFLDEHGGQTELPLRLSKAARVAV